MYSVFNAISAKLKGAIEVANDEYQFENSFYKGARFIITVPIKVV